MKRSLEICANYPICAGFAHNVALTQLTIEPAQAGDAEWCAQLMASIDPWVALGRKYHDCLARCRHPEYLLLVARWAGQRCGFILLHPLGLAGSPYVAAIAVSGEFRGQSIGSALLRRAELLFPNSRHLFLCVSSFNTRARSLYERRGYRQVGELPDYVVQGASEILMHKSLERQ